LGKIKILHPQNIRSPAAMQSNISVNNHQYSVTNSYNIFTDAQINKQLLWLWNKRAKL